MWVCTECLTAHKTERAAANCHWMIGGVIESLPGETAAETEARVLGLPIETVREIHGVLP